MKKVIALTRVSTLSQELESQKNMVIEAIYRDGYADEEIISISNKESGVLLSEEEMLGLDKLKEEIENQENKIESVYVFELSRIARQGKILYSIRDFLISHSVQLVCLNPSFRMLRKDGSFDESSNVIFGIYVSMAESEGFIRKQRFKRGKEKARAEGRYTGGRILYGYKLDAGNHFILDPEKSEIVKRIYRQYCTGFYSARQISTQLYNEGIIHHSSFKSREMFVTNILKNKHYHDGTYEPIVSQNDYARAKEFLDKFQSKPKKTYEGNIYFGHRLLFVEENKRQMMVRKHDMVYYEPLSGFCISMNMVDSLLLYCSEYSRGFHSQSDIEKLQEKYFTELESVKRKLNNYAALEKEIKDKIDRVEERLIIGKLSPERAGVLEKRFEKELTELAVSRQKDFNLITILEKNLEAIQKTIQDDRTIYDLSDEEKNEIVKQEIEKIWVSRVKNSHYILRLKYKNPLIDGQIFEVWTKQHKICLYGKKLSVKIIYRFHPRKNKIENNK